jgi:ABC-type microcin C transport system permease subunit YejB
MSAYIIRRVLFMIPKIFAILVAVFVIVQFAPGGPVARAIQAFRQQRRHHVRVSGGTLLAGGCRRTD